MKISSIKVWQTIHQAQWNQFASLIGYTCWTLLGLGAFSTIAYATPNEPIPGATEEETSAVSQDSLSMEATLLFATPARKSDIVLGPVIAGLEPLPLGESLDHIVITPDESPPKRLAKTSPAVIGFYTPTLEADASTTTIDVVLGGNLQTTTVEEESSTALTIAEGTSTAVDESSDTDASSTEETDEFSATDIDNLEAPLETYQPLLQFQAAGLYLDDEVSGRLRASALYALNPQVMFGATVDLVGGDAFVDSADEGLSLNELYVAAAPFQDLPNLRFVGGLIDLTSYFDRNSFAKDVVTHFFNPVFQTNPALSSAGIGSRPGVLVNWSATDQLEFKAAAFSSDRDLGDWALDGFAAEAGYRAGNFIIRGSFATARDAGDDNGFTEIFQIQRGDGRFGLRDDDREIAYGLNAEYFIDSINLGLFGRFGWYDNQGVDRSGTTFSFGGNALDVFLDGDRLGLGYGRQLSNGDLRSGEIPDVWEVFYDAPIYSQVRAGISLQSRDEFSDTSLGFRVRADW